MSLRIVRSHCVLGLLASGLLIVSAWAVPFYGGLSHPFPGPGVPPAIDSFFDVFFEIDSFSIGPGSLSGTAHGVSFPLTGVGQVNNQPDSDFDNIFVTEILSLNLSGGGILIRESPTLQSTGTGIVTPDGHYVSSFFDIFTELSIDGGTTWRPSTAPLRLTRVPDAGSTIALLVMALGLLGWARSKSTP